VTRSTDEPLGFRGVLGTAGTKRPTSVSNESESAAAGVINVALEGQGPGGRREAAAELTVGPLSGLLDSAAKALVALGHALVMGAVYALIHALGPDHLGTLMTLSAAAGGPVRAFRAGAAWGAGHCLGMVVLVAAFACLGRVARGRVDAWEHYGDYLIGASMVACAVYFVAREPAYVQQEADGTEVLRGCSCHGPCGHPADVPLLPAGASATHALDVLDLPRSAAAYSRPKRGRRTRGSINSLCTSSYAAGGRPCPEAEAAPGPPPPRKRPPASWGGLGLTGALLGVFQAACCPSGLIGVSFIVKLPAMDLAAFCVSFTAVSILGTGLLALSWALLGSTAACRSLSAKALYRASCGLTFVLGVAWIAATFHGFTLEFVRVE